MFQCRVISNRASHSIHSYTWPLAVQLAEIPPARSAGIPGLETRVASSFFPEEDASPSGATLFAGSVGIVDASPGWHLSNSGSIFVVYVSYTTQFRVFTERDFTAKGDITGDMG